MSGYITNIEQKALENPHFREVLFTAERIQLVVMALQPGEDIGAETHDDVDQFIRVESGMGKAVLDGKETDLIDGSVVVIPAGTAHNIINASVSEPLKLYTLYSPPEHPGGTITRTRPRHWLMRQNDTTKTRTQGATRASSRAAASVGPT